MLWPRIHAGLSIVVALMLAVTPTLAQKGGKGGGKGGGGDEDAPKYSVWELAEMTGVHDLSDPPQSGGDLWVAGRGSEGSTVAAMYGRVTPQGTITVDYLPEPRVAGDPFNGSSWAFAVNNAGDVAGSADVLDQMSAEGESFHHAVVWIRANNGFQLLDLDANFGFAYSEAKDINNHGRVAGRANVGNGVFHAMLWDLVAETVDDLNDMLPSDSPWLLTKATQVNDAGKIAGEGLLDGVRRGFVATISTDPGTGEKVVNATAVPLPVGGGPKNTVNALTEDGQVTGWADSGSKRLAYYWDGESPSAINLGSLTDGWSHGSGLNLDGHVVGESDLTVDENSATFWGADNVAVALETQIPQKPTWLLDYATDINDQGLVLASGRKKDKGTWTQMGVILVPNE